ncbi:hypothetical protein ABPG74_020203 [Tetrahymena malaccensis]
MGNILGKSQDKANFYYDMVIQLYQLDDQKMILPSKPIAKQLQQKYDISDSEFMGVEGVQGLAKALKKCTNLKTIGIQVPQCHNIVRQGAAAISQALKCLINIQQLQIEIQCANRITDLGVQDLVKSIVFMEKLNVLDLKILGVNEITDIGIQSISEAFDQLKNIKILSFEFDEPNQVSYGGFKCIFESVSKIKNLEKLGLGISLQLGQIEFECIENFYLDNSQKQLSELNLKLNSNLENNCISILLKNCSKIKTLSIDLRSNMTWLNVNSSHRFQENIQSCTDTLEKLTLNFSNYQKLAIEFIEELMKFLCQCKNLKILMLSFRVLLMDERFKFLYGIKNLENLITLKVLNIAERNSHKYYEILKAKKLVKYNIN